MKIKKILLPLSLLLTFCAMLFTQSNLVVDQANEIDLVRNVESSEINYDTYFGEFDDYSIVEKNDGLIINVNTNIKISNYEIDNVSYNENGKINTSFEVRFDATTNKVYLDCNINIDNECIAIETIEGLLVTLDNGTIDTVFNIDDELILLSDLNADMEINSCGWLSSLAKKVTKSVANVCTAVATACVEALPYIATTVVVVAVGASAVISGGATLMLVPAAYTAVTTLAIYTGVTAALAVSGAILDTISDAIPSDTADRSNDQDQSALDSLANDLLSKLTDKHGWTADELISALSKAMNLIINNQLTKVREINKRNFKVYLGVFLETNSSYEKVAAQDNGSVVFSMDTTVWNKLWSSHGGENGGDEAMWILNQFFLSYVISKNCEFVLVANPNRYYDSTTKQMFEVDGKIKSYSKELNYINHNGYSWNVSDSEIMISVRRG